MISSNRRAVGYSALTGLVYGLFCRLIFTFSGNRGWLNVMTIGFLMLMPLAVGFIAVYLSERAERRGPLVWLGLPALTTVALMAGAFVLFWEGIICLTLLLPLAIFMSMIGGGAGAFCARRFGRTPLVCVALLPFLVAPAEQWIGPAREVRNVETSIVIQATPATVWRHIERVAPIRPEEQRFSWSQAVGFPRPVEATLSAERVGGVRHATFDGGILFVETVTAWEPERRLAFDIRADTVNIPPHTLDEHVTIGGPYFDTLEGQYTIEPMEGGGTLLHLSSRHRLSTTFNFYAGFWSDAVMRDLQDNILYVIRNRCEAAR